MRKLCSKRFVKFNMITLISKQLQVFNAVISRNSVNMMNNFFTSQFSSKIFFHYNSMFKIIFSRLIKYDNVSMKILMSTSTPVSIIYSNISKIWLSFHGYVMTIFGTMGCYSYSAFYYIKDLVACNTRNIESILSRTWTTLVCNSDGLSIALSKPFRHAFIVI